jgi:hypothetical protein
MLDGIRFNNVVCPVCRKIQMIPDDRQGKKEVCSNPCCKFEFTVPSEKNHPQVPHKPELRRCRALS